ncbi:unnamed protein product [Laminaria digitata]
MLRGSLLATLAGTATVCAGLIYLKPGSETPDQASSTAGSGGEADAGGSRDPSERGREGEGEGEGLGLPEAGGRSTRLRKYRAGPWRCITALSPSAKTLIRLLGMICVLLAVRKWQLLRRAAVRAGLPRSMYGGVSR